MAEHLKGKVALITGGARGIGAAIARRLAKEGADIVFSYSASETQAAKVVSEIEMAGRRAVAIRANQAITSEVDELVRKAHATFGRLDILVNSAGVFVTGLVGDSTTDTAALDRQLDINLKGVVTAVRTAVPLLSNGGSIVSIGTAAASHRAAFPGISDYVASKAAVAAYTRGWARDLGARKIRVNIVEPGPINTEMAPKEGPIADMLKSLSALGRYGEPEEVAAAVAFLVGPEAQYITGVTLNVDGGLSI
jgi:3-oxoacyl-[acyl-carrier protein] reductase